jgi:hypothetical protein
MCAPYEAPSRNSGRDSQKIRMELREITDRLGDEAHVAETLLLENDSYLAGVRTQPIFL